MAPPFLPPVGNLELVTGRLPATPSLLVEVTELEAIRTAIQGWMQTRYRSEEVAERAVRGGADRLEFAAVYGADCGRSEVGFWQSENVLHGKPLALEGDLSAAGCGLRL